MTTKLYDLFASPKTDRTQSTFVMRAPMSTISSYLDMHKDGIRRVETELADGAPVSFIFTSRGRFTDTVHAMQKAVQPLGGER